MRDITQEVGVCTDLEFYWGEPQEVLVVFRNGDFLDHRSLETNTLDGAVREARRFIQHENNSTRKVAHA